MLRTFARGLIAARIKGIAGAASGSFCGPLEHTALEAAPRGRHERVERLRRLVDAKRRDALYHALHAQVPVVANHHGAHRRHEARAGSSHDGVCHGVPCLYVRRGDKEGEMLVQQLCGKMWS